MKKEIERTMTPAAFAIERRPAARKRPHVVEHITGLLRAELADLTKGEEAQAASVATRSFGGFGSAAALDRHITEWKKNQLLTPTKTMSFTVPVGTRVVGPPYDHGWHVGLGMPFAQIDGTMMIFGSDGFSASGASLDLTSTQAALASIKPMGAYEFSWVSFDNYPSLRSRGGLGILVYGGGDPAPLLSRQAVLWTLSGVSQFAGNKGSGQYADAVAFQTSFGPVPLAPILINMSPNVTYEVWMWCWLVGQNQQGTAFLNVIECKIPFVLIDAGPPIIIK